MEGNIGPFSARKVVSERINGQKVDTGKADTSVSAPEMKQDNKGKFKPQLKVSANFSAEVEKTFTSPDVRPAINNVVEKVVHLGSRIPK